jgi:hypothetical protein
MDNKKVAGLMMLGVVVYAYYSTLPNDPVLLQPKDAPSRHDLTTGSPFEDGNDYQPASLTGSGKPPRYMTYQYQ